jgi:hypothetical protein
MVLDAVLAGNELAAPLMFGTARPIVNVPAATPSVAKSLILFLIRMLKMPP